MHEEPRALTPERRASTWLGWAAMALAPLALMLLAWLMSGQNPFSALPVWADEVSAWRELYTWNAVGLGGGYAGLLEEVATRGTLGVDGLTPVLLYGWFVKLFGLAPNTVVWCNIVWLTLAAIVFCALVKPQPKVAFTVAGLTVAFVPLFLYCATSMTELFGYALALIYLALLLKGAREARGWPLALCFVLVAFGTLCRTLYWLLNIPLILVYIRKRPGFVRAALLCLSALLVGAGCMAVNLTYEAPNAQSFMYHLLRERDVGIFVNMILSHTKANLVDYFTRTASPMECALRWLYMLVTAACLAGAFLPAKRPGQRLELLGCAGLLLCAFGFVNMFYETGDWNDFRTLSPFLWLVLAFLAARPRPLIPRAALAASVAMLAVMLALPPVGAYSDANRFSHPQPDAELSAAIAEIVYEPDAQNPLTNTVRLDVNTFQAARELDPGLGLQYGWFTTETTGKSRWILTDHLKCTVNGYERVADTGGYKVYRLIASYEED